MDDSKEVSGLTETKEMSKGDDTKETGRIEAFSDGVFAVAITLLVLNIQAPPLSDPSLLSDGQLGTYILHQGPMLVAFVSSFATIGVMWTIPFHRS